MQTLSLINFLTAVLFTVCYAYQYLYIPVSWFGRKNKRAKTEPPLHDFAVLICARNEEAVIGDLVRSLRNQTYPREHLHIFVMADNCTDRTGRVAGQAGAEVYYRNDRFRIGKGYALEALLSALRRDFPKGFDGYFVFDADNLLEPDYIEQMNRTFSEGNDIITSYRNSRNYGDNWISAGYGLWFLRESRYLNQARYLLNTSCSVSGTGFFFSRTVSEELGGWPFHLLTEDIEFSADQIVKGRKIAFCRKAVLYDEQPVKFRQSWRQRMRWSRGYLQVFRAYGGKLLKGIFHGSFSCFDMAMNIMPAFILTSVSVVCNVTLGIWGAVAGDDVMIAVKSLAELFGTMYLILFAIGGITTLTEWKQIRTSPRKKVLYAFTFPLFMFTYVPISIASFFVNPGWKPIVHTAGAGNSVRSLSFGERSYEERRNPAS